MRLKSTLVVTLGAIAVMPLLAAPAHAGKNTCPAAFPGGPMGALSINSSHSLLGYGVGQDDKVAVDRVQVDPSSGLTKYRLAEAVTLINARTGQEVVGGVGSWYFAPAAGDGIKDKCVDKKLGGVRGPFEL